MSTANRTILRAELTDDPLGRGYASMTDAEAAVSLGAADQMVDVASVTGQQIFEAALPTDRAALNADQKGEFYAIIGMGNILVSGINTRATLAAMFGGTDTLVNLQALQTTKISRATELGLAIVRVGDIQEARAA